VHSVRNRVSFSVKSRVRVSFRVRVRLRIHCTHRSIVPNKYIVQANKAG